MPEKTIASEYSNTSTCQVSGGGCLMVETNASGNGSKKPEQLHVELLYLAKNNQENNGCIIVKTIAPLGLGKKLSLSMNTKVK